MKTSKEKRAYQQAYYWRPEVYARLKERRESADYTPTKRVYLKPEERKIKNKKYQDHYRGKVPHRVWFNGIRARSKAKGVVFSMSPEDVPWPSHCPILGIPLFSSAARKGATDNSPSCDKIEPSKGYVSGNVRVISNRANTMKRDYTDSGELYAVSCDLASRMSLSQLADAARDF